MENSKLDCRSVCTAILGYGTPVETLDGKYQSGLLLNSYSNIRLWDCGRDTCLNGQARAKSVDPDQTPQKAASDVDLLR